VVVNFGVNYLAVVVAAIVVVGLETHTEESRQPTKTYGIR